MKSPGLGLCCAQGNIEQVPNCGTGTDPKGSGEGCSHHGGPQAQPHRRFHQHPRSFHCILQNGHPSGTDHLEGKPSSPGDLRSPGTNSLPHQVGWGVLAGFPQHTASPKATICPTEESAMAPTCSQTPENRLDRSCIPNGGGWGGGAAASKQGETFRFHLIRQGIQEETSSWEAAKNPQHPGRDPQHEGQTPGLHLALLCQQCYMCPSLQNSAEASHPG